MDYKCKQAQHALILNDRRFPKLAYEYIRTGTKKRWSTKRQTE